MIGGEKMRVKLIFGQLEHELESEINEFISGKKVFDIKFTESEDFWTALIMYDGEEEDEGA